jgi:flavin reductase (DIM6/NTAB) family NADH-FMN oxidoreductase RutF
MLPMEIEPSALEAPERYKLLIGAVVARPIALVSTISADGRPNLAPFSFFTAVGSNPMTMLFCPANLPDGSEKDTLRNAKPASEGGTGEFVVNVAVEPYATKVAGAAERLAYGESEFELVGLTPAPSRLRRVAGEQPKGSVTQGLLDAFEARDRPAALDVRNGDATRALIEDEGSQHGNVGSLSGSPARQLWVVNAEGAEHLIGLGCACGAHHPLSEEQLDHEKQMAVRQARLQPWRP